MNLDEFNVSRHSRKKDVFVLLHINASILQRTFTSSKDKHINGNIVMLIVIILIETHIPTCIKYLNICILQGNFIMRIMLNSIREYQKI